MFTSISLDPQPALASPVQYPPKKTTETVTTTYLLRRTQFSGRSIELDASHRPFSRAPVASNLTYRSILPACPATSKCKGRCAPVFISLRCNLRDASLGLPSSSPMIYGSYRRPYSMPHRSDVDHGTPANGPFPCRNSANEWRQ